MDYLNFSLRARPTPTNADDRANSNRDDRGGNNERRRDGRCRHSVAEVEVARHGSYLIQANRVPVKKIVIGHRTTA